MSKLKKLNERRADVYTELTTLRSQHLDGVMDEATTTRWNDLMSNYSSLDDEIAREEQFSAIERGLTADSAELAAVAATEEQQRELFRSYLNGAVTQRDLDDGAIAVANGAVSVPQTIAERIEEALIGQSAILSGITILKTDTGGDLTIPTINDSANEASFITPGSASSTQQITLGSIVLKAYTLRTPIIPISYELLQDTKFDLDTFVAGLFAKQIIRKINKAIAVGTGTNEPKGLITAATAATKKAASATAIAYDDILSLMSEVEAVYGENGSFVMNTSTFYAIRGLKDDNGRPLWEPQISQDAPAKILGKPYYILDGMDSIGADKKSLAFGDISKYYLRMVRDFTVIRFDELYKANLSIGLQGFARLDGQLVDAGTHPVKYLLHPSAAAQS